MQSKDYTHISDEELLENFFTDHDNDWLGILLPRYTLLILGVSMKYLNNEEDAKDCVQQVFLKTIDEMRKYKVTYFKSWIYMVAKNYCLMKLRDKGKTPVELNEQMVKAPDEVVHKDNFIEKDMLLTRMEECLRCLSPEQQQCVTLFYLEKKSYSEITSISGFSMMQVKSHIQNGKRNLRIMMESEKLNN